MSDVPPPVPPSSSLADSESAPPRKRFPVWGIVLIVLGVLAIPGIACVVGAVTMLVPKMKEKGALTQCQVRMSQLGGLFLADRMRDDAPETPRSGPGLFLEWRKERSMIRPGEETALLCPNDPAAKNPPDPADYDAVDVDAPPPGLCSFAVRDFAKFPLEDDAADAQAIAACLHHPGGVNLTFDNGSTRFFTLEELGLDSGTTLTVGPDSPAPILRTLTYGPGR